MFNNHVVQQSVAFKILRTRLKTVPSYSFSSEQQNQNMSPEASNSAGSNHVNSGPHSTQDGVMTQDVETLCNGINFVSNLHEFQKMQKVHRVHAKSQAQSKKSSVNSTKVPKHLFL